MVKATNKIWIEDDQSGVCQHDDRDIPKYRPPAAGHKKEQRPAGLHPRQRRAIA